MHCEHRGTPKSTVRVPHPVAGGTKSVSIMLKTRTSAPTIKQIHASIASIAKIRLGNRKTPRARLAKNANPLVKE